VVAPALFDRAERNVELGYTPDDVARGRDLRGKLKDDAVMADVEAAAKQLAGKTLGIVGYCFGGTIAWWGATRSKSFKAAVGWYGGGIAGTKTETPSCPVQLHFGEKDTGIPLTDVEAIRAVQPKVEILVYPGAQHGFGCDERGSFSAPEAKLAMERTLAFLKKNLG
jgi:carboxymethylenebutenolidase